MPDDRWEPTDEELAAANERLAHAKALGAFGGEPSPAILAAIEAANTPENVARAEAAMARAAVELDALTRGDDQ